MHTAADLPVLAVCGFSGSGKTTLLEGVVPRLHARGLSVAIVKHDAHGADVDRRGADSDRLFRAWADVLLDSPGEKLMRLHAAEGAGLAAALDALAARYDLVLVEGHKATPLAKVWLAKTGESAPPAEAGEVLATLPGGEGRLAAFQSILDEWLPRAWRAAPVLGCVLIGGKSTRMGRPKHLIAHADGRTWLERTVDVLRGAADEVVLAGAGEVPGAIGGCTRLPDVPDAEGPLAGLLAAMRWSPRAGVLACACDLPDLSPEALAWILDARAPGRWAIQPRLEGAPHVEPLLAYYDFRSRALLEELAAGKTYRPGAIAPDPRVHTPTPPPEIAGAWRNANE